MTASELMADLARRGVELRVEDGTLRYRARVGTVTPELRAAMSAHKVELLALLMAPSDDPLAVTLRVFPEARVRAERAIPVSDEKPPASPHVTDPDLADWYASHPEVTCARCWLARQKEMKTDLEPARDKKKGEHNG